jgi:hypothetical protein
MIKGLIYSLVIAFGMSAQAAPTLFETIIEKQSLAIQTQAETQGLNWKVGDKANYSMNMGIVKGTMEMVVREKNDEGFWLDQNMNLGFLGKQNASILIDPNTGQIKKFLVNGKEQQIPEQDVEVIDATEEKVTVPAGTFDVIHFRINDKKQNQEMHQWVNPKEVPVMGMVKSKSPGQFGEVTLELTSFKKN